MSATGRMRAATAAGVLALALTGCGAVPGTVVLASPEAAGAQALPDVCLGPGLDLALGAGAYAVPLGGTAASAGEVPSWEKAALQMAPDRAVSAGPGPFTLCSYVADHPTPFSSQGGDDTIVCVLVDAEGTASLLGVRTVASGATAGACTPTEG